MFQKLNPFLSSYEWDGRHLLCCVYLKELISGRHSYVDSSPSFHLRTETYLIPEILFRVPKNRQPG
jgi:hypothetical protein